MGKLTVENEVQQRRTQPPVSVIITCFNQGQFLAEAIESVLLQDYPDVEIVVVDDGSTDSTAEVSRRYPQTKYLGQENQGLAAARNVGIRASKGDFLVFLDADDRLRDGALTAGVECMQAFPDAAFVSGGHTRMNESGQITDWPTPPRITARHYQALLEANYIGMHGAVMYRRGAIAGAGGFDESLPACEDYDLYLRLAQEQSVGCHDHIVADYRIHGGGMSAHSGKMLSNALHVLRRQRSHIKNDQEAAAYRNGIGNWKKYYSERRFSEEGSEATATSMADTLVIIRHTPLGFLRICYARRLRPLVPVRLLALAARLRHRPYYPSVGRVRFGDLRRAVPVSRWFGFDRGLPVDRCYIESFLERNSNDVRGRILEIGDDTYTGKYGGDAVTHSDVLHIAAGNPKATIVADLSCAPDLSDDTFDCAIVTQTLHLIYDVRAALKTLHRVLKPGGVLLLTVPGISHTSCDEWRDSWYWSFTTLSISKLVQECMPGAKLEVEAYGNVLAATAFLQGLATEDLTPEEMNVRDPQYELVISARVEKQDYM